MVKQELLVVTNAGCARSRYTLILSLNFFNELINELINRVYLERLIRR